MFSWRSFNSLEFAQNVLGRRIDSWAAGRPRRVRVVCIRCPFLRPSVRRRIARSEVRVGDVHVVFRDRCQQTEPARSSLESVGRGRRGRSELIEYTMKGGREREKDGHREGRLECHFLGVRSTSRSSFITKSRLYGCLQGRQAMFNQILKRSQYRLNCQGGCKIDLDFTSPLQSMYVRQMLFSNCCGSLA